MEVRLKVVDLGDEGVGKTSIVNREFSGLFKEEYPSSGLKIESYHFDYRSSKYILDIWEMKCAKGYESLIPTSLHDAHVVFVIFSLTYESSFNNIDFYAKHTVDKVYLNDVVTFLVGNKSDLKESRVISKEIAEKKAEEYHFRYIETSAFTGENVKNLFDTVCEIIYQKSIPTESPPICPDDIRRRRFSSSCYSSHRYRW